MQNIFDIVDDLQVELNALSPISPEVQKKLDNKFRLEFNYNSNHIEGNTLTYGETELLLIFDDTRGRHTMREYEEMKAHDVAYRFIREWAKDVERPLNEQIIKNLNEIILVRPFWKEAITPDGQDTNRLIKVGDYKEFSNSVRLSTGEIFQYASPIETPILMQELIEWYRTEEKAIHPVTLAAMLHYKFVRIHPFDDGNGRVARLLMNYVLLRNNFPPVIIKSNDKANYLHALHDADTGKYDSFIEYIGTQLKWSLEICIKAAKGESIEEPDDIEKELTLLKKELKSIDVPEIVATKNAESIKNVLKDVVKIVKSCKSEISRFKEYYKEYKEYYIIESRNEHQLSYPTLEAFERNFDTISSKDPYSVKIGLRLNYFIKSLAEPKNDNSSINIYFNPLDYLIGEGGPNVARKYNQVFAEDEIKEFAKHFANNRLKMLKLFIEEVKKNKQ